MSAWLDKPDGPGWWWRQGTPGVLDPWPEEVVVIDGELGIFDEDGSFLELSVLGGKWQRVQPPREE